MPTDDSARLLNTSAIAERLGVSREWVRRLADRDDFPDPIQQVGRMRLWRSSDVERWIAENRPEKADE
jgi:predicted DNA-binding transcriptional regulator AlpA